MSLREIPLLVLFVFTSVFTAVAAPPPNIVVFLADDQGWGDLSCNGNINLQTPNIDSLMRDGATLDYFFVCQVCAPTRAEFLTGRYYPRTGVSGVTRGAERLNRDETTIADLFKRAGYTTGAFGKWHNGTQPPYHPNFRGFDEFYGFTSGHWSHYFSPPLDHNGKKVRGNGFIADDFTDHAISFIEANSKRPFFCYLAFNTPHAPMMVPDYFYEKFDGKELKLLSRETEREDIMMTRAALALCENLDWNVGRVLQKLDELQLRENTIVVYFSDNGPNSYRWNGGMKGKKGSIDEGGVRSPFFIRWPGKIKAGMHIPQIAGAIDLLPTLTELAGIDGHVDKPLDGISLADFLLGKRTPLIPRTIFSVRTQKGHIEVSVRTQQFRLDANGHLFDMVADPEQRVDAAALNPELTASLMKQAHQHAREMKKFFELYQDRPFTVGYAQSTTLPARDGNGHGTIQRSSKAPNNSFFTHWTRPDDYITWDVEVENSGDYDAIVYYTCQAGNEGVMLRLSMEGCDSTQAQVTEVFDPPLYDKSKERVEKSHYFMKDFKPLNLGTLHLEKGRGTLKLDALDIRGKGVVDVFALELNRR